MSNYEAAAGLRELSTAELSDIAGGAINVQFEFLGLRFFFHGGEDWQSVCVANQSSYSCSTVVGGQSYSSSGPVPQ